MASQGRVPNLEYASYVFLKRCTYALTLVNLKVLAKVALGGKEDVDKAVEAAKV